MSVSSCTRIVLAARPHGAVRASDFRIETAPLAEPAEGEVQLQVRYLSLDPYMRGRMDERKSYAPPVALGSTMEGETAAQVIASRHPDYAVGDIVLARTGWCSHANVAARGLRKLDPALAPITTGLGVLGMPGFTAYSGLRFIGQPRTGETVVVAAASGPVGSLVGQWAQIQGARAVGIAGGADKCAHVRDELGFDAVVDHRAPDFPERLAQACPDGVDVYFENVGGAVWQAVLPLLNKYARVPVCGLVAQYDGATADGPNLLPATMREILSRSLTLRGFINFEFAEHFPDFLREVGEAVASGRVRYREDIVDGLENAPRAFMGMLKGANFGKLLVRVS
ncbi:NADP-dependent oxidoreductase [Bordetella genomosp. 9]|uniref:NADP-dependent oxidoreductase n=1 Tax=Bordetella genomosp. 9 TaxID=1416803 RepID=A0A261R3U0_9BORD|nr:NADP-dependent oxidoreductase [Bordetella genomosp. 9]OZI19694.1 NADP-dependent oxidoreductase [Bordetella genomosp. 9]